MGLFSKKDNTVYIVLRNEAKKEITVKSISQTDFRELLSRSNESIISYEKEKAALKEANGFLKLHKDWILLRQ